MFETFDAFLQYVLTPAGLGAVVVVLMGWLKRLDHEDEIHWLHKFHLIFSKNQMIASVIIAAIVTAIVYALVQTNVAAYIAPYWHLILLVWSVGQGEYAIQKAVTRYARGEPA